jgi:hypothetical protein
MGRRFSLDSPRHNAQLQLTPSRVPRSHALNVIGQVRLAVDGLSGLDTSGELGVVLLGLRGVLRKTHESDWERQRG